MSIDAVNEYVDTLYLVSSERYNAFLEYEKGVGEKEGVDEGGHEEIVDKKTLIKTGADTYSVKGLEASKIGSEDINNEVNEKAVIIPPGMPISSDEEKPDEIAVIPIKKRKRNKTQSQFKWLALPR